MLTGVRYPTGEEIFLLSTASRTALGLTKPHTHQWLATMGAISGILREGQVTSNIHNVVSPGTVNVFMRPLGGGVQN